MIPIKRIIPVAFVAAFVSACGFFSPNSVDPLPTTASTLAVIPAAQETASIPESTSEVAPVSTPFESGEVSRALPHYQLDVLYDHARKNVRVDEIITYPNISNSELAEIVLMVESNRYGNVFHLDQLAVDQVAANNYVLDKNILTLTLDHALLPGSSVEIKITYDLQLAPIPEPSDNVRPELFGYTERQVNLVDWYPQVAMYEEGQGWLAYHAWYYGEHQVYQPADYDILFRLTQPVPNLTIAASALGVQHDDLTTYQLRSARNFALSISEIYQTFRSEWKGITVISYTFPFEGSAGEDVTRYAVEALETYSELFGPYPHSSLAVVEADFLDGMEFEGLFFLSKGFFNIYDGQPGSYLGAITVHETAHQWWYSQVGNNQAQDPWLDEALCTYSELLFYEARYPEEVTWWEQVRVNFYEPTGVIDLPVSEYAGYLAYRNAVYLRGALFYQDLRSLMGDEAFFGFLRELTDLYRYEGILTPREFFALLSETTTTDISPLLQEYFSAPVYE